MPEPDAAGDDGSPIACLEANDTAAILAAIGEAAYVWDAASDKLVWSPNAAKVIGVESFADLTSGRRFAGLLDPDNPFNRHDAIFGSSARDAGGDVSYELRYALKSDPQAEPRWIEDCGRCFAGPDGKLARPPASCVSSRTGTCASRKSCARAQSTR
jgi:PAS domain-containing protein